MKPVAEMNFDELVLELRKSFCCLIKHRNALRKSKEAVATGRAKRPKQQLKAKSPRHVCNTCSAVCAFKNKSSNMYCASWKCGPSAI